jgi:membrane protein
VGELGAVVALVLWLLGSLGFSDDVDNFGKYNQTYGALAAVIILLLGLFLAAFVVPLGAELDAETEPQAAKDTTTGPARPLGERDAEAAHTLGESPRRR